MVEATSVEARSEAGVQAERDGKSLNQKARWETGQETGLPATTATPAPNGKQKLRDPFPRKSRERTGWGRVGQKGGRAEPGNSQPVGFSGDSCNSALLGLSRVALGTKDKTQPLLLDKKDESINKR